ncbi:hypothetical protein N7454_002036 [Penicillium verhagenii]|nr:hypothetical protein N7454_002036 [Penicillium verhagenii]
MDLLQIQYSYCLSCNLIEYILWTWKGASSIVLAFRPGSGHLVILPFELNFSHPPTPRSYDGTTQIFPASEYTSLNIRQSPFANNLDSRDVPHTHIEPQPLAVREVVSRDKTEAIIGTQPPLALVCHLFNSHKLHYLSLSTITFHPILDYRAALVVQCAAQCMRLSRHVYRAAPEQAEDDRVVAMRMAHCHHK